MLVGGIGPNLDGRDVSKLRFSMYFSTWHRLPDETFENDAALPQWEGTAKPGAWQFLRFGETYVALRFSAKVHGTVMPVRRLMKHRYLCLEMPLIEGRTQRIDQAFRELADFGMLVEMGSASETGTFADFRKSVLATAWEFHHNFYRNSRFLSRHGELQIIDSVLGGTSRFIAIDGEVEPETELEATGLDPALTRLFQDGRRIIQRRTLYRPDCVATPFYDRKGQILEKDLLG